MLTIFKERAGKKTAQRLRIKQQFAITARLGARAEVNRFFKYAEAGKAAKTVRKKKRERSEIDNRTKQLSHKKSVESARIAWRTKNGFFVSESERRGKKGGRRKVE